MNTSVTVVIPSIPPRRGMLKRAVGSVLGQTVPPAALSIAVDLEGEGAAVTRNRALQCADATEWVAFLDDDDQFLPHHLEALLNEAAHYERCGIQVDYLYSWFTADHADPLGHFGKPFDPTNPTQTTITTLVRRKLAQSVGFSEVPEGLTVGGQKYGEDYQFTLNCLAEGARIVHVPVRTWIWNWHGANTSGEKWTDRMRS